MSLKEKETLINEKLRQLDPHYAIVNLRLTDPAIGRYDFDIVKDFANKHMKDVKGILRSVLGVKSKPNETKVTTKLVLPQPAYQKLQQLKRTRHKSQSEIVAELLLNA
jgi:hypothetical protein